MPRIRAATIDQHKQLVRRSLLDAARRMIDEAGTAEVPLGEIALIAGVGRTTFYDYFSDRDDVIASLVEDELPRVIGDLIAEVSTDLTLPQRLAALASGMVRFVAEDRVFGVILHREVGRMSPEAQLRIRSAHADLSGEMASIYRNGVESGLFAAMPSPLAGRLIQDCIMSAARVVIDGGAGVDEVTESMSRFLLAGLGHHRLTVE